MFIMQSNSVTPLIQGKIRTQKTYCLPFILDLLMHAKINLILTEYLPKLLSTQWIWFNNIPMEVNKYDKTQNSYQHNYLSRTIAMQEKNTGE